MVEYCEPKSPLGVAALLEELEATFSPEGSAVKRKARAKPQIQTKVASDTMNKDDLQNNHQVDFIADELATLMCNVSSDMKDMEGVARSQDNDRLPSDKSNLSGGVSSMVAPLSRSSSRGSSLWSGSHSSSSAYSASTRCSQNGEHTGGQSKQLTYPPEDAMRVDNARNTNRKHGMVPRGAQAVTALPIQSHEAVYDNIGDCVLDDADFSEEYDFQEARALSLRPKAQVMGHEESMCDDDFNEEFELQQARSLSMQPRDVVFRDNDSAVDFDEEYNLQDSRAFNLDPPELVRGFNDSMADFDEEFEFQEARALSMQPRELVMGINDSSSIDFDEEFEIQEARTLSMQSPELALAQGGHLPALKRGR